MSTGQNDDRVMVGGYIRFSPLQNKRICCLLFTRLLTSMPLMPCLLTLSSKGAIKTQQQLATEQVLVFFLSSLMPMVSAPKMVYFSEKVTSLDVIFSSLFGRKALGPPFSLLLGCLSCLSACPVRKAYFTVLACPAPPHKDCPHWKWNLVLAPKSFPSSRDTMWSYNCGF